jgi:hypothetical protein
MGWEVLLVPAIAIGVWVLGTLIKNATNQDTDKLPPRVPPDRPPAPRRPAPPGTDLDRFLREVNRRKQAGEQPAPRPKPLAPPPQAARRTAPAPPPRPVRPAGPAARPPARPAPVPPSRRPPLQPVPVAEPVPVLEVVPLEEERRGASPGPTWQQPPQPPAALPAVVPGKAVPAGQQFPVGAGRTVSPALATVHALLRSPQGLRSVMVLREILDPPLSMRGRGGSQR